MSAYKYIDCAMSKKDFMTVNPNIWGRLRCTWRFFDKYCFNRFFRGWS